MPNVTISLNEKLLKAGRAYAQKQNRSLNDLIRELLEKQVMLSSEEWLDEAFSLMDDLEVNSGDITWSRDDLHER